MPRQDSSPTQLTWEEEALVQRLLKLCLQLYELESSSAKFIWGDWQVAYCEEGISGLHRLVKEAEDELRKFKE